jgi:hypothetical protein
MVTYRNIQPSDTLEIIQTIDYICDVKLTRGNLEFKANAVQIRESCDVIRVTIRESERIYRLIEAIQANSDIGEITEGQLAIEGKVITGIIYSDQPPSGACVAIEFKVIISEKYQEKDDYLTSQDLIDFGFEAIRKWDEKLGRFRMVYEKEGYDCKILISPFPNVIGDTTPEEQIEQDLSSIQFLEEHHTGDWHVYAGSFDTHLANFHYCNELCDLMLLLGITRH